MHPAQPHLKRVLGLWDLIYYGVILTSPIAAVPLFGEGQVLSHGHTVATLLLAMVAMSVTAVSFGRMALVYPSAGSVYTYISRGLNPHLGFVVGWAMFLEYLFQPVQNALYAVLAIQRMAPQIPFALLAVVTVGFITLMTVQGIKFTARTNEVLLGFMVLVTAVFLVQAVRYVVWHEHFSGLVFAAANLQSTPLLICADLAAGTSLAALVFIGFDGVSILAEEVKNPKRMFCWRRCWWWCLRGCSAGCRFIWRNASGRITPRCKIRKPRSWMWREWRADRCCSAAYGVMLLISSIACGLAGHVGAARLLYSMGRDDVLPKKIFGYLSPTKSNPVYNIWIVGLTGVHCRADYSVGTGGRSGNVWRAHCFHGRESLGLQIFLVCATSGQAAKLFCRCICARIWVCVLSGVADQLADVDEICGTGLAGIRHALCGIHHAGISREAAAVLN